MWSVKFLDKPYISIKKHNNIFKHGFEQTYLNLAFFITLQFPKLLPRNWKSAQRLMVHKFQNKTNNLKKFLFRDIWFKLTSHLKQKLDFYFLLLYSHLFHKVHNPGRSAIYIHPFFLLLLFSAYVVTLAVKLLKPHTLLVCISNNTVSSFSCPLGFIRQNQESMLLWRWKIIYIWSHVVEMLQWKPWTDWIVSKHLHDFDWLNLLLALPVVMILWLFKQQVN